MRDEQKGNVVDDLSVNDGLQCVPLLVVGNLLQPHGAGRVAHGRGDDFAAYDDREQPGLGRDGD